MKHLLRVLVLSCAATTLAFFTSCKPAAPSSSPAAEEASTGTTEASESFFSQIKSLLREPVAGPTPKYVALYYSAQWCPPCRMFTPKLVEWYKNFKKTHPDFELVFVSADQDESAMNKYITEDRMPWAVAAYDNRSEEIFQQFSSDGIPYLVLIGANGKALTAKPDNEWQSPDAVLEQIEKLVPPGS